jgi:hypothetical protein
MRETKKPDTTSTWTVSLSDGSPSDYIRAIANSKLFREAEAEAIRDKILKGFVPDEDGGCRASVSVATSHDLARLCAACCRYVDGLWVGVTGPPGESTACLEPDGRNYCEIKVNATAVNERLATATKAAVETLEAGLRGVTA